MDSNLAKIHKGRHVKLPQIPVIVWGLIVLLVILGIVSPTSVLPVHLLNFFRQAAPIILVGIGQTIVMIVGGVDLSVASTMVLVDVMACQMMAGDPNKVWVAAICLLVGLFIGLINGLLCAKLHMPSFVVTLGMSALLTGIAMLYCNGVPKGSIPKNFRFFGNGFCGPIPTASLVWLISLAIMLFVMKFLPIGKYIRCTGVNEIAVLHAGRDNTKIQILCYALCGLFAALAGLVLVAYVGTGSLQFGDDYQMHSIATSILDGAAFSGGKGSLAGTAIAGLFMVVMYSLVAVLNMSSGMQGIIQGVIILVGLSLNTVRKAEA